VHDPYRGLQSVLEVIIAVGIIGHRGGYEGDSIPWARDLCPELAGYVSGNTEGVNVNLHVAVSVREIFAALSSRAIHDRAANTVTSFSVASSA
jgi:hypothetical protein